MVPSFLLLLLFQIETRRFVHFTCHVEPFSTRRATSSSNHDDELLNDADDPFEQSMQALGFTNSIRTSIHEKIRDIGFSDSSELAMLAADFKERPEVFSSLLQTDFRLDALSAHRTRAAVMNMISDSSGDEKSVVIRNEINNVTAGQPARNAVKSQETAENCFYDESLTNGINTNDVGHGASAISKTNNTMKTVKRPLFKSVVVNEKAQKRRSKSSDEKHDYGLTRDYQKIYPKLGEEMDSFFTFMTRPSTASQEAPIRPATANVYMRHAKLFLGWFLFQHCREKDSAFDDATVSICDIVPTSDKQSADCFLEFIVWLRTSRSISVSYEANVLRGLTKLLKFRFASQSKADPAYGEKSFDDIPAVRELRKLHRDANKRQILSPRSSDEDQKWLSWQEYLGVIQGIKTDLLNLIDECHHDGPNGVSTIPVNGKAGTPAQRKVAIMYQQYLILSFLACVPDRQRTIRELKLNRSFVRDKQNDVWTIKHGPDDYKTGKTYGDRPPLMLSPELVPAIDDFLEHWRQCLAPNSDHLFVQPRTGNPLTQDSVYQIVARSCYKYSGKRTNPHLLRDMIVTHVRESDASEKELEALALYMGHSISMQRNSYDRRTLTKKVAPAVELLQSVNKLDNGEQ